MKNVNDFITDILTVFVEETKSNGGLAIGRYTEEDSSFFDGYPVDKTAEALVLAVVEDFIAGLKIGTKGVK